MQTSELPQALISSISRLTRQQQILLIEFIESLTHADNKNNEGLDRFAGTINKDDLMLMSEAIEKDSSKIDENEW